MCRSSVARSAPAGALLATLDLHNIGWCADQVTLRSARCSGKDEAYLLLDREMSTRQEVWVINVKYHCHKATKTLMSTKSPAWLTPVYPVDPKLYPHLCIARDCFMILMLRTF